MNKDKLTIRCEEDIYMKFRKVCFEREITYGDFLKEIFLMYLESTNSDDKKL